MCCCCCCCASTFVATVYSTSVAAVVVGAVLASAAASRKNEGERRFRLLAEEVSLNFIDERSQRIRFIQFFLPSWSPLEEKKIQSRLRQVFPSRVISYNSGHEIKASEQKKYVNIKVITASRIMASC